MTRLALHFVPQYFKSSYHIASALFIRNITEGTFLLSKLPIFYMFFDTIEYVLGYEYTVV